MPPWPAHPAVPGTPSWEPPPAFTAAAAGMPVWPAPVSDPHAVPPWPAATGELVAEPDEPPQPSAFDPDATEPEGVPRPPHHPAAGTPDQPSPGPAAPPSDTTRPGIRHTSGPHPATPPAGARTSGPHPATPPDDPRHSGPHPIAGPAGLSHPASGPNVPPPGQAIASGPNVRPPGQAAPHGTGPTPGNDPTPENAAHGNPAHGNSAHGNPAQDNPAHGNPAQGDTPATAPEPPQHQGHTVPLAAPVAIDREATLPPPAENAAPDHDTPQPSDDPTPSTPDDASTGPQELVDPPEPGDVPVWPPTPVPAAPPPHHHQQQLPDLPFSRDTWGQRKSTSLDLPTPPQGVATTAQKGTASAPAFPPGAFKQPPFQIPPPPPPPSGGGGKRALLVTLGALALAGIATGGFFAYQAVSSPSPTTAAARTAAPSDPGQGQGQGQQTTASTDGPGASILNSEQTDPQKLSLSEAFPKKKVSAAGTTFKRVKAVMETTCGKAATGAFAEALDAQKCTRVLRATYVDGKKRYAVTTGIAVLPTKEAATAADQAKDLAKNVWFRPLPGPEGSGGERVQIAGGYAAGLVWGRYIVFSYATHADGRNPSEKDKTLPKVSGAFRDQTSLVLERRVTKD
ncbi:hypothetical protein [Nonomuraea sp. NPDC050783]|uniref:hypothetical protein n=1 Tax=Nonomuraea sp. NPDC050783 TaxID=3154634 RepID=UPI0034651BA3